MLTASFSQFDPIRTSRPPLGFASLHVLSTGIGICRERISIRGHFGCCLADCHTKSEVSQLVAAEVTHTPGMPGDSTLILGIEIPSTDPLFVGIIAGLHIPLGVACVVAGAMAMLSEKRRGRHSTTGKLYYWCLLALVATATFLSIMRWAENYHLFLLGASSFVSAWLGRKALRMRWRHWARLHITGMGLSYVLMLVAFYVDNGKQLPLWKDMPHFVYWLLPFVVGIPLIVGTLLTHPIVKTTTLHSAS